MAISPPPAWRNAWCVQMAIVCPIFSMRSSFVPRPVGLMGVVPGHDYQPVIWPIYRDIILRHEPGFKDFEMIERFAFYERAKQAYAILSSSETALYANIILKKGVVIES
jgi:L-fucose mutarotase